MAVIWVRTESINWLLTNNKKFTKHIHKTLKGIKVR